MSLLYSTIKFCSSPRPVTLLMVAVILAPTAFSSSEPQKAGLLSAFFGLDNGLPRGANNLCPGAAGQDGMPVVLSHTVDPDTLQPEDFRVFTRSGAERTPLCLTLRPANDAGELRTVLLIGEFGDAANDPPVKVLVVDDLFSDGKSGAKVSFRGAETDVIPLEAGPTLVLAEVVSEDEWSKSGRGSACPAGTLQVVRSTWAGGVRLPNGDDAADTLRALYRVTVKRPDGSLEEIAPAAVAELGDRDNNHFLCLDTTDPAVSVSFAAGHLVDPNQNMNPDTHIAVAGHPVSNRPDASAQSQIPLIRVLEPLAAKLEPSRIIPYKTVGRGRDLELHVFEPEGHDVATDKRPCILIIHGGGWTSGEPRVYYTIADHYAKKGMLAVSLQYRLMDAKDGVTVFDCVKDGRSAMRWLRAQASTLGIDPNRIAVIGGSAGGHVALGTAVFENGPDVDEATDDLSISCVPDLLIPLNPVIDTSADGYGQGKIGERWRELSPLHHVKRDLPPMLICHSTGDTVTPYAGAARFVELSKAAGNDCQFFTFEGGRHGWFIFDLDHYVALLGVMDEYLKEKGFLF